MVEGSFKTKIVSVVIPAYNEEATITEVINTALTNPFVDEVIVVSDGSTDNTVMLSLNAGAKVLKLTKNYGKAKAMEKGIELAKGNIICFLDADLIGLDHKALNRIIFPVLFSDYDMYVAIRRRRTQFLNRFLRFFPLIGGERTIKTALWSKVPEKYCRNFQIEIALNYFSKKNGCKMGSVLIDGLTQVIKEKKRGIMTGLWQRLKMTYDIIYVSVSLYFVKDVGDAIQSIFNSIKKRYENKKRIATFWR